MSRDDIAAVFSGRDELWQTRDASGLAQTYSDDSVVTSPIFGTVKGREAVETSYRNLFKTFSDWDYRGEEPVIDGRRAAQAFTVHMTHSADLFGVPPSGRKLEIHGILLFEFDEAGLIAAERRVYDFTGMLVQAGVLKAKLD